MVQRGYVSRQVKREIQHIITLQISPGCHGNMTYFKYSHNHLWYTRSGECGTVWWSSEGVAVGPSASTGIRLWSLGLDRHSFVCSCVVDTGLYVTGQYRSVDVWM